MQSFYDVTIGQLRSFLVKNFTPTTFLNVFLPFYVTFELKRDDGDFSGNDDDNGHNTGDNDDDEDYTGNHCSF